MTGLMTRVQHHEDVAVIELSGEIDGPSEAALKAAYVEAARLDPSLVVLDFHKADYMNSTGIALIVGLLTQARAAGRRLAASGLSEHYTHIFQITRLMDYIAIFPDAESALAAAAAAS